MSDNTQTITVTVNGQQVTRLVRIRQHLVDFLRMELGLTGSHLGCEHGVCGACSVRVDNCVVRGCLMLAVQVDGSVVETVEGLTESGEISDLQDNFVEPNSSRKLESFAFPSSLVSNSILVIQSGPIS